MSEFDLSDLVETLNMCRQHLPQTIVPELEARLDHIEYLLHGIYTRSIEAVEQERVLYKAPADIFDFAAAARTEQWVVEMRPLYRPDWDNTFEKDDAADDQALADEPWEDETDESLEGNVDDELVDKELPVMIDHLNYWFNPYTKLQQQRWHARLDAVNQLTEALIRDVPDHPSAATIYHALQKPVLGVIQSAEPVDPASDPFILSVDVFDPDHVVALTKWLFNPAMRRKQVWNARLYRKAVERLRQIVAELPSTAESEAIGQARAFITKLCSNCGHPGVLAPKHFNMCASCSHAHPLGGPNSLLPITPS